MDSYLNVAEVESAIIALAAAYPDWASVVTLPNATHEGRTSHALLIGDPDIAEPRVLFTGCQHAREWGGAEICVAFATDLLHAVDSGTGLAYGSTTFSPPVVARIVKWVGVLVFPCVNPDGRAYDQAHDLLWRKNRNPASSGGLVQRIGVDVNRNHDFLWDIFATFDPEANPETLGSDDPGSPMFQGDSPDSEPETRNIHWLFDTYPSIDHYLDIHCCAGKVIHPWGDDTNQSTQPSMSFQNSVWNRHRGVVGGYAEWIPAEDLETLRGEAEAVRDAVNGVRGGTYTAVQSFLLWPDQTYPTSGSVLDWAYARHLVDADKTKVIALCIEFGEKNDDLRKGFHPPWSEMVGHIADVDAGLVRFCARVDVPDIRWWKEKLLIRRLWPPDYWQPAWRRFLTVSGLLRRGSRPGRKVDVEAPFMG